MRRRQCLLIAAMAPAVGLPPLASARSGPVEAEAALRQTVSAFFEAWNRHDVAARAEFFAEDIEWVFVYSDLKKGRANVSTYGSTFVRDYDVSFEVAGLKLQDGGRRATLVLRGQYLELPVRDGKYVRIWNRYPLLMRWRVEGGAWRLYYANEHVPAATEIAKSEGLI